ncbi:hypothetical protein MLD38_002247 [Melastoma candidum]|uniref:Uncharacterized protein n=1 Tax=Melastoma candidum TaxID=119954 RepID=A0ACB9SG83_9MYRT|nr:hypothetical protein MLD38_002247 [Melastoma candidum]
MRHAETYVLRPNDGDLVSATSSCVHGHNFFLIQFFRKRIPLQIRENGGNTEVENAKEPASAFPGCGCCTCSSLALKDCLHIAEPAPMSLLLNRLLLRRKPSSFFRQASLRPSSETRINHHLHNAS